MPTLPGMLHLVSAGVGFLALVATSFVLATRFRREGRTARAGVSIGTGLIFLAGFAGVASSSPTPAINLAFTAAVVAAWAWLSATSVHLYHHLP